MSQRFLCNLFFRGVKLRPGVAASKDGLSFDDREGPILELGEKGAWDENGVSWPRVLPPEGNSLTHLCDAVVT